jgi:PAS domain S-box-containing protein
MDRPERILERLARLQAVTAALAAAVTPAEVADVVMGPGVALLGARAGAISVVDGSARLKRLAASRDFPGDTDGLPLEAAAPPADAVRAGRAVWLGSPEERAARYPHLAPAAGVAWAEIALVGRRGPFGAISFAFDAPHPFQVEDRTVAVALADGCAIALERSWLFDSERALRARAEETAALLQDFDQARVLVDQVKDYAIFMLDPHGQVRTWNRGAERIKGYRADEIIGSHFSRFYSEADVRAGKPERELEIAAAEGRCEDEGIRVRKDGSTFRASVILTALRDADGTLRGFTKVTRDVTDRRRIEEERLRLARAEEGVRARDEFLSIASHELRTPIAALGLQTQGLVRLGTRSPDVPLSRVHHRLQTIDRQSSRLAHLVDAMLDVTHITAGRLALRREPLDLTAVVRDAMERWRDALARAHCDLQLHLSSSITGRWDRRRLGQIIDNLLANAVKYGAGRPVEVVAEGDGANARIVVRDEGIGIAPEDQERIFRRFERAVPTWHYGGLGLGLWIVRNLVEAHGGDIRVSSEPGRGSSFDVSLPREGP